MLTDAYKTAVNLFHEDYDVFETLTTVSVKYHDRHPDSNVYRTTNPVNGLRPLPIGNSVYTGLAELYRDRKALGAFGGGPETTQTILIDCLDKIN